MVKTNFKIIITKYLNNDASASEMDILAKWLENDDNHEVFKDYVTIHHVLNSDKIFDGISAYNKTLKVKSLYKRPFFKYAVAASIMLFISLTLFLTKQDVQNNELKIVNSNIEIGTDKAILTLADGSEVALEQNQQYTSNHIESHGKDIIYKSNSPATLKTTYNYLTIPRGGQFFVQLADGTKVWLNSESKLKYPVQFVENQAREVTLLYGEAYFDVSPSANHNGTAFNVLTRNQEVNVLGTEFNIKAYREDDFVATTLIEGKVTIKKGDFKTLLKPEQQSIVKKDNQNIIVNNVDISSESAWKNGFFNFNKTSLSIMLKTLSRWYDLEVVFVDDSKKNLIFSGVLKRTSNVEELLTYIEKTRRVVFEVKNNTVYVK
ncbi:FecR domain-containing protein [uncultured Algibacter sp.]|uniref:FecR family protein n=1 Tax=uncultured Algibacter sp. TaxID=298659 RepID=UPI003216767D